MTKKQIPKGRKGQKSRKPRVARAPRNGLDAYGAAYARLLVDPCGAPLTHPTYAGGDAGFLFRADSVLTFGGGATETCGFLHWTPGYVNSSNSDLIVAGGAAPGTALTAASNGGGPGKAFLNANAFGSRCVAACMKISYPGSEQSRSGRVHYGHTQGGTVDVGDTVSVDQLAPLLQHYSRTPADIVEILWRPGAADQEFNDPNAAATATLKDRKTSVTFAWAGLPVATGFTVHFTAVYEWTPRPGQGVSTNTSGKNPSISTLDHVIDAIQRAGFVWVRNAAHAASMGAGLAITRLVSNTFGSIPARPVSRLGYSGFGMQQ